MSLTRRPGESNVALAIRAATLLNIVPTIEVLDNPQSPPWWVVRAIVAEERQHKDPVNTR